MNSGELKPELISVVMAVFNEAGIIASVVASVLNQVVKGYALEVLVVDGRSTDGSDAIVRSMGERDSRIRLLYNDRRKTPFAFNIGLREASGEYVCIFGAHAVYAPGYIATCLEELKQHNAAGCSGRVILELASDTLQARLVYWAMSHPFGSSGRSFRTQPEGYVDSIAYPVFRKQVLEKVGGYDETLTRNQDNEMNYRIRKAGYKLYCTWKTHATYRSKSRIRDLVVYARQNGYWCGVSARTKPRSLGLRHYVPFVFTVATLLGIISLTLKLVGALYLPNWLIVVGLLPLPLHLIVGSAASLSLGVKARYWGAALMPAVFLWFHLTYGMGFVAGFVWGGSNKSIA
jgi:glycosyltransferase involved in cell wall biosynthesis